MDTGDKTWIRNKDFDTVLPAANFLTDTSTKLIEKNNILVSKERFINRELS